MVELYHSSFFLSRNSSIDLHLGKIPRLNFKKTFGALFVDLSVVKVN